MDINFFDNPQETPRMREDVRFEKLRIEVSPEGKRVAVDVAITPFIERPTIELYMANGNGEKAGLLTIIETLDRVIQVVIHLRDREKANPYTLRASLYYSSVDSDMTRQQVDECSLTFDAEPGETRTVTATAD
ncbi:MAG: hypothetical protein QNJ45_28055 [Ardenticatenaceae bacterium]|nr:hypothetical protein [Ardenticatenaceae bacterium]